MTENLLLNQKIEQIKETVDEIKRKLDDKYVTKVEFNPIKQVVYGLVYLLGGALLVAIVKVMFK